jgi:TatA/E family protein of Tat protein translocase
MMGFLESPQVVLLLILVLALLFGAPRLPKLARSLREARDEFQKGQDESEKPNPAPTAESPAAPPASPPAPAPAPPVDKPPPAE